MNPSEEVIDKLMALFESNHDSQLGEAIIISLSHMDNDHNSDRIFQFLTQTAKNRQHNSDIRQHAIISLGQFGKKSEIIEFLLGFSDPGEDPEIQEAMLMALAELDMKAADEALMKIIRGKGLDDEYKAQALYFLGAHGKLSVDFLKDIYAESGADSEELKYQVWHLLSSHDDEDAALDTMLDFARTEKDAEMKQEMVFWIGQFDDPRAVDFLVEILEGEH